MFIQSPFPPEKMADIFRRNTQPFKKGICRYSATARIFRGEVKGMEFTVMPRPDGLVRNAWAPLIKGHIEENHEGSILRIKIEPQCKKGMYFVFGFCAILFIVVLCALISTRNLAALFVLGQILIVACAALAMTHTISPSGFLTARSKLLEVTKGYEIEDEPVGVPNATTRR